MPKLNKNKNNNEMDLHLHQHFFFQSKIISPIQPKLMDIHHLMHIQHCHHIILQ